MTVRIIAGDWKGRRLNVPPGMHTRPLLDRIKQSLFDSLGQYVEGLKVIDVCAGSGSFGFEAASRYASSVHLIDNDPNALKCLHANKALLKNPSQCLICPGRFQSVLKTIDNADLIYADPPFPWYKEDQQQLAEMLASCMASLAHDGRFLIRGDRGQDLPALPAGCIEKKRKKYGRSWIAELGHQ